VRLLARRELSEAQVRDRLGESFEPGDVDAAVARLKQEGAVDDRRVAAAHARTAILVKRRGRLRVERELEAMGIDRAAARKAVEAVLEDVDERAVLAREVERRVKGRALDARGRARVCAQLLRLGFPADLVVAALGRHRPPADNE
jgi:SOS response regulatory protein OraA/RecX